MTEEALNNDEALNEEVDQIQEEETNYSEAEEAAMSNGWRPKEEWEGPEGEWRSAEVFNERGIWIDKLKENNKRIDNLESGFNQRLENVNKLHDMQLETQKSELERKRQEAIESADVDSFNSIQKDLDNISQQQQQVQQPPQQQQGTDQSAIDQWNQKNQWAFQPGPKTAYANAQYNNYVASGYSVQAALSSVDADIAREFPSQNLNQNTQASVEKGSKPTGSKRAARNLTMADCTPEELNYYRKAPNMWGTQEEFLKAVKDSRGNK